MAESQRTSDGLDWQAGERRIEEYFSGLLEISNLVGSVLELNVILDQICAITARMFRATVCSVYLLEGRNDHLTLRANYGLGPEFKERVGLAQLPVGHGLPGISFQTNQLIAVPDASQDPRHETVYGDKDNQRHAYLCNPLRIQAEVVGVMTLRRECDQAFSEKECLLFETVCKQVAIVIEKSRMYFDKVEAERLAAISISLSEVAHYIKNLLQSSRGGSFFIDLGFKRNDLDMVRKGWDVLQRANKKIGSLVMNMLNYSRELDLKFEKYDVNALIYEILHQVDDSAVERGVALIPELQLNIPKIRIDHDKMYDAFLNLITNGIDAISEDCENGYVLVKTRLTEDRQAVDISFRDNGVGIPNEIQTKIFNLFFSTKGDRGSGIGLASTRKIIERHSGSIWFDSEEGNGTTFTIRLPVAQ